MVKKLPASAGNCKRCGSVPVSGRFSGEGNGYSFQYLCLENSIDKGAWRATVHRVAKSQAGGTECARTHGR